MQFHPELIRAVIAARTPPEPRPRWPRGREPRVRRPEPRVARRQPPHVDFEREFDPGLELEVEDRRARR